MLHTSLFYVPNHKASASDAARVSLFDRLVAGAKPVADAFF
jgi:hypothetical protein